MPNTKLTNEIWVTTPNKVGALSHVTAPLAEGKINIEGLCAWVDTGTNTATFMMLTANNPKARDLLKQAGYKPEEKEVVVTYLDDKPGTCWNAAQKLSQAGVDINYTYFTTCGGECPGQVVFNTKDNNKAVKVLG